MKFSLCKIIETHGICVQFLLALYLGKKWKSTDDTKFSQGTKYRKSNTVMLSLKIK